MRGRYEVAFLASLLWNGGALAHTPSPLPGFPSCDYSRWKVVAELPTGDRAHWAPDGRHIVATKDIYDITACPPNAEAPCAPVEQIPWGRVTYRPTWSPDGDVIVFDSPDGPVELPGNVYTVQSEGEGTQLIAWHRPTGVFSKLTSREVHKSASFARFAHGSLKLTWIEQGLETDARFVPMVGDLIVESDGKAHLENVEALVEDEDDPAYGAFNRVGEFTADDAGILLISTQTHSGDGEVWKIDLATREWTNLTNSPTTWEEHPRSSPNGQKIGFMSTRAHPGLANLLLEVSWFLGLTSRYETLLIFPYALIGPRAGFANEQYLANPDGSEPFSPTMGTQLGAANGWSSRGGEFGPDGTKFAFAQRPMDTVEVPGLPSELIQINGQVLSGRTTRTVVLQFECTEP